jgi:hypothetical protein
MSFFEKLRNRSETEKRRIAIAVAGVFTIAVIVIWVLAASFGWSDFSFSWHFSVPGDLKEAVTTVKNQASNMYSTDMPTSTESLDSIGDDAVSTSSS